MPASTGPALAESILAKAPALQPGCAPRLGCTASGCPRPGVHGVRADATLGRGPRPEQGEGRVGRCQSVNFLRLSSRSEITGSRATIRPGASSILGRSKSALTVSSRAAWSWWLPCPRARSLVGVGTACTARPSAGSPAGRAGCPRCIPCSGRRRPARSAAAPRRRRPRLRARRRAAVSPPAPGLRPVRRWLPWTGQFGPVPRSVR